MKCIKYYPKHGGEIVRISDGEAHSEVNAGKAMYTQKWRYKKALTERESAQ